MLITSHLSFGKWQRFLAGRWAAILGAALATCLATIGFAGWAYDDPFITYRYADNLARGLGFVYNLDQHVLSTTTPLFTLLLGVLKLLPLELPLIANAIGTLSLGLGALCLWELAQAWEIPLAGWAALVLYPFFPLLLSTLGSETPFYLALCLGAFACYARQRYSWAAVCSALAILTRMDAVLVPLLLALDYWARERRPPPWRAVALFVILLAPWFIFSRLYFGQWLPATLAVKQAQGRMLISQKFAPGFPTLLNSYATQWHYWLEAGLAILGIGFASISQRRWLVFLAWPIVYFAAYSLLGVTRYFWYYAPLVPGFVLAVGLGLEAVWVRWQNTPPPARRYIGVALCVIGVAWLVAYGQGVIRQSQQPDPRYAIYRATGEWLSTNIPPEASVGTLEVGIIGYYAQRPMIDFAGLLRPEVAQQMAATTTYADTARWAIAAYHPDYLVLNPVWFPALMQEQILPHCAAQQHFPGAAYGFNGEMVIYQCAW